MPINPLKIDMIVCEIEVDGVKINKKIEILMSSDTPVGDFKIYGTYPSGGLIEAPSYHILTINIGNQQRGRIQDCKNPYGDEHNDLKKKFYDIELEA